MHIHLSRRAFLGTTLALATSPWTAGSAWAAPAMIVHRDASCSCCESWVGHIRAAGLDATVVVESDMSALKTRLGVPDTLVSCHTAEIGGYLIEGHVPASVILRLLNEKPVARGLSAPGMPAGAPGMASGGTPETYDIILFGRSGTSVYGRYRGGDPV
jgi:hypothetical protein